MVAADNRSLPIVNMLGCYAMVDSANCDSCMARRRRNKDMIGYRMCTRVRVISLNPSNISLALKD